MKVHARLGALLRPGEEAIRCVTSLPACIEGGCRYFQESRCSWRPPAGERRSRGARLRLGRANRPGMGFVQALSAIDGKLKDLAHLGEEKERLAAGAEILAQTLDFSEQLESRLLELRGLLGLETRME